MGADQVFSQVAGLTDLAKVVDLYPRVWRVCCTLSKLTDVITRVVSYDHLVVLPVL